MIVLAAYWPALSAGFVWDDDDYVTQNMALRTLGGLRDIWIRPGTTTQYYPVTYSSFWIERRIWGDQPRAFHAGNIGLQIASAVLLWRVLLRLGVPGAWWAALIWAIYPVQVESVAWVTERKNCLSGMFYFLAALMYLRSRREGAAARGRSERIAYAASVIAFGAALMSKTAACSLPAALLLVAWWKAGAIRRRDVLDLLPHFVIGLLLSGMTVFMEHRHVGAAGEEWQLSVGQRVIIAGRAVVFYLGSLLWQARLAFVYPRWAISTGDWRWWLYPAGVVAGLAGLWAARGRIGRGPIAAGLFFVGTLLPTLGFVDLYYMRFSFVADHFQYLACAGPIVLVVGAVAGVRVVPRAALAAVGCAAAVGLSTLTFSRCRVFRDSDTLWRDTLAKNPAAWLAMSGLGYNAEVGGRVAEAADLYGEALSLAPGDIRTRKNLAGVLVKLGDAQRATELMREGVARAPRDKLAHFALGDHLASIGQVEEAAAAYREALRIDPEFAEGHNNHGTLLLRRGDARGAARELRRAVEINPYLPEAQYQLGEAIAVSDRPAMAEEHYAAAIALRPDWVDARLGLAGLMRRLGNERRAVAGYRACLAIDPNSTEALTHLGWIRATSGEDSLRNGVEAMDIAQRLLKSSPPDSVMPLLVMAAAQSEMGQFATAAVTARTAREKAIAVGDAGATRLAEQLIAEAAARRAHRTPSGGSGH